MAICHNHPESCHAVFAICHRRPPGQPVRKGLRMNEKQCIYVILTLVPKKQNQKKRLPGRCLNSTSIFPDLSIVRTAYVFCHPSWRGLAMLPGFITRTSFSVP